MKKSLCSTLLAAACLAALPSAAMAGWPGSTVVPGQQTARNDVDGNNIADAGVIVSGGYAGTYVDGATTCALRVTYRGDFNNDPYLDSGVINNHYVCKGPDGNMTFNYQIVSSDQPNYTGSGWPVWGTWEFRVLTQGGQGNEPYGGNGNIIRRP